MPRRLPSLAPLAFVSVFGASMVSSAVAHASAGGCTEQTFGVPCDPGDGNACGGVCMPDFTQTGAPMGCIPVNADVLGRLKLATLDGIDCSPAGAPGTDCGHACSAGTCVATSALAGAACVPGAFSDGGVAAATVCAGACNGSGECVARADHFCEKYGRGELSACLYTACNPAQNTADCDQFPSPSGVSCSTEDVCVTGETCGANGTCGGGTRTPGCTEPSADAGATLHGDDSGAGGSPPSAAGPSSGCSVGAPITGGGARAFAASLLLLAVAGTRRRARGSAP